MAIVARLEDASPLSSELIRRVIDAALSDGVNPAMACDCARMLSKKNRILATIALRRRRPRETFDHEHDRLGLPSMLGRRSQAWRRSVQRENRR